MALDMFLELEGDPPDWGACLEAARRTGVTELHEKDEKLLSGAFSRSGMYFWRGGGGDDRILQSLMAEGYHGCNFLTRYSICFRINNSVYDECVEDLKTFLTNLAQISPMQFVLSFQGDGVYAVRNRNSFEFFWHEPHGPDWRPPMLPADQTLPNSQTSVNRWWRWLGGKP